MDILEPCVVLGSEVFVIPWARFLGWLMCLSIDLIFELQEAKDTNMRRYTICFASAGGRCGKCR